MLIKFANNNLYKVKLIGELLNKVFTIGGLL